MKYTSLYFSRMLNGKIFSGDFQIMGKLLDLAVAGDAQNPNVYAAIIKTPDGTKTLSFKHFSVSKRDNRYHISCSHVEETSIEGCLLLKKNVLDKQIIDMNGRKVVRVNDIRLVVLSTGIFVVAVDIGLEGLFRRLGIAKSLTGLGLKLPSKFIFWNDVETVLQSNDNVVLSKTYDKLSTLHASDLADIIEDFDTQTGMLIFNKLDNERAADVLEEMDEETQLKILENLPAEKAADILEEMPSDESADILESMNESRAEELLLSMEKDAQEEIRELMEYEEHTIGSIMNNEFVAFSTETTAEEAIRILRETKPEEGMMNYIYVTNAKGRLVGKVSLRDLLFAGDKEHMKSLMHKDFVYLHDTEDIDKLIEVVSKYNLLSIPIVSGEMHIVGNVVIHDILDELIKK